MRYTNILGRLSVLSIVSLSTISLDCSRIKPQSPKDYTLEQISKLSLEAMIQISESGDQPYPNKYYDIFETCKGNKKYTLELLDDLSNHPNRLLIINIASFTNRYHPEIQKEICAKLRNYSEDKEFNNELINDCLKYQNGREII